MMDSELNKRVISCGKEMFASIRGETPSLFDRGQLLGRIMAWTMRDERFKTQLFRFVDVFPSLTTGKMVTDHMQEYFPDSEEQPAAIAFVGKVAGRFGTIGDFFLRKAVLAGIKKMARQFIVGENGTEAMLNIERLRTQGFASVVDVLGEATLSEKEADFYVDQYLHLIASLDKARSKWKPLGLEHGTGNLDWGHAPQLNVSVKATALYCLANPQDFEGSVTAILKKLQRICNRVVAVNGFLCLDMETYRYKEIVLEVFRRLKLHYRDYPHLGIVLQSYLRDTDPDLEDLISWGREHSARFSIRLVKGAYWDYEVVRARQNNMDVPVWRLKSETDAAFERQARRILENGDVCHLACASHNIRSIAAVIELACELGVPADGYEFQVLYGMAEPVRKAILNRTGRLRLYCPYGPMVPGMGYLVRRLLENTSNVSFLRQTYVDAAKSDLLLADPAQIMERERLRQGKLYEKPTTGARRIFCNEPVIDFARKEQRQNFQEQVALVRQQFGRTYPLHINGKDVVSLDLLPSVNPANPAEVIGLVCQAGTSQLAEAILAAKHAFEAWRETTAEVRSEYLVKAATVVRGRIFELAAWQVLEIGKQWDQAYADVTEAVDFLEFYAGEMVRGWADRNGWDTRRGN